jgi:hypothetical protein
MSRTCSFLFRTSELQGVPKDKQSNDQNNLDAINSPKVLKKNLYQPTKCTGKRIEGFRIFYLYLLLGGVKKSTNTILSPITRSSKSLPTLAAKPCNHNPLLPRSSIW